MVCCEDMTPEKMTSRDRADRYLYVAKLVIKIVPLLQCVMFGVISVVIESDSWKMFALLSCAAFGVYRLIPWPKTRQQLAKQQLEQFLENSKG